MNIANKCCNQFGERDEIQTIINSLQADVVTRGNRIAELERALRTTNDELEEAVREINRTLMCNIKPTEDRWDFQIYNDNLLLLGEPNEIHDAR